MTTKKQNHKFAKRKVRQQNKLSDVLRDTIRAARRRWGEGAAR